MKTHTILLYLSLLTFSCTKSPENFTDYNLSDNGVYILNEGNFGSGTGSISFYSYSSEKVYNDLFLNINGWPLGDIPNSMNVYGENAYIVVNNSGKIEVVNINTLESVKTIDRLISPRNILFVGNDKAYVTSIYSDSLTIISLIDNSISGYINIRRSSESIVRNGNLAYVANWAGGNEIMIINTLNDEVIDSIEVGMEPESMVIDKNNSLWVLCNGGWSRLNFAELVKINTGTNLIEDVLVFPDVEYSPTCLNIDGEGETLYYLERGVRQMNINSSSLPVNTLIAESGQYFYKMGINPMNSDIFVTDAIDYQQQGNLMYFKKDGTFMSTQKVDISPAFIYFKLNENFLAE